MLWAYRRGQSTPTRQSPVNTAVRSQFNTFTDDSGEENSHVEVLLGLIEGEAAPLIRRIVATPDSFNLSDRRALAVFLGIMGTRTVKRRRVAAEAALRIIRAHLEDFLKDDARFLPSLAEYNKERGKTLEAEQLRSSILNEEGIRLAITKPGQIAYAFSAASTLAGWLETMPWALIEAPPSAEFVTSDSPLVILAEPSPMNPEDDFPTEKVEVTFPIDPKHCLLIKPKGPTGPHLAPRAYVEEVVRRTVEESEKEVYCAHMSPIVARLLD